MEAGGILAPGTLLADDYEVIKVLGFGGFGNTYLALDRTLGREVAIKEFFPREIAFRETDTTVRVKNDQFESSFNWGLERFVQEARLLAKFRHPNIVRVFRTFEAHRTSYIVLDLVRGPNLEDWLRNLGRIPTQVEIDEITAPLVDALALVHTAGVLHRDIKPDNVCVREETGDPVLLDFGSSKYSLGEVTGTTAAIVSRGYSPFEAYAAESKLQGPWTDVYGLGATIYRALTGSAPPEATERLLGDTIVRLSSQELPGYRPDFLAAVDWALGVKQADRPQSVSEWQARLYAGSTSTALTFQSGHLLTRAASDGSGGVAGLTGGPTRSVEGAAGRKRGGALRKGALAFTALALVGSAGVVASAWQRHGDALFEGGPVMIAYRLTGIDFGNVEARRAIQSADLAEAVRRSSAEAESWSNAEKQRLDVRRRFDEQDRRRYEAAQEQARRQGEPERRLALLNAEIDKVSREIDGRHADEARLEELLASVQQSAANWARELSDAQSRLNAARQQSAPTDILAQIASTMEAASRSATTQLQRLREELRRSSDRRRGLEDELRRRQTELQLAKLETTQEAERDRRRRDEEESSRQAAAAASVAAAAAALARDREAKERRERDAAAERDAEARRAERDAKERSAKPERTTPPSVSSKSTRAIERTRAASRSAVSTPKQRSGSAPTRAAPTSGSGAPIPTMTGIR